MESSRLTIICTLSVLSSAARFEELFEELDVAGDGLELASVVGGLESVDVGLESVDVGLESVDVGLESVDVGLESAVAGTGMDSLAGAGVGVVVVGGGIGLAYLVIFG